MIIIFENASSGKKSLMICRPVGMVLFLMFYLTHEPQLIFVGIGFIFLNIPFVIQCLKILMNSKIIL